MRSRAYLIAVGTSQAEALADAARSGKHLYWGAAMVSIITVVFAWLLSMALRRQRGAGNALVASEAKFRATFEQAAVGIAHTGLDGRFLQVNQKLCDMLGYTREELLGKTLPEVTHPAYAGRAAPQRDSLLAGDISTFSVERRCLRKDGGISGPL